MDTDAHEFTEAADGAELDVRGPGIGLRRSAFDVRRSAFRSAFALLPLLSVALLAQAQANRPSGILVGWGTEFLPYVEPGTQFIAIAAGAVHTVALKRDGAVVAWGANMRGESTVPVGLPPLLALASAELQTLALVRDPAPSLTILRDTAQTVILSWSRAGALEQTESLTAPNWQPAPSQANPQILGTAEAKRFYRVKGE